MTRPAAEPDDADEFDRDAAIRALSIGDTSAMERLASDWRAAPEILFFLSQAPATSTRAKVAGNPSTPDMADDFLLNDEAAEVRASLGRKIAAKLPEFSGPEADRLRDAATAKLLILARDCEVEVRRALSSAVADLDCIPKEIATTLARDVDALVSVPIVEFSPLLDDDDLIALIAEPPTASVLAAMARRKSLSPNVVDQLVSTEEPKILIPLLHNTSTQIRESALERIVDFAHEIEDLQAPLVARPELTERLVLKLSRFVASSLIFELSTRVGLSDEARRALEARLDATSEPALSDMPSEDEVLDAVKRREDGEVYAALSRRAGVCEETVRRVFSIGMAKAIVALAWKSELSMAAAVELQSFPGRILRARRVIPARDGSYPMGEEELEWHLSTLGIGRIDRGSPDGQADN